MDPITTISECVRGDGRRTVIAGNKTTLFRYVGTEDPTYFDGDYFDSEFGSTYFDDGASAWAKIGDGFSPAGRRWEAVQIGDYLTLNNGVDLPMTYHLGDDAVKPIYELREQQIASVGTIGEHKGVLTVADIRQINDDAFRSLMATIPAAVAAAQDAVGKVTPAAATLFPSMTPANMVGLTLFWGSGEMRAILAVDVDGFFVVDNDVAIQAGAVEVENVATYAAFTDESKTQRFQARILPSMPGLPRRWGAIVPVNTQLGSRVVRFNYPVRSVPELVNAATDVTGFAAFTITGAGPGATNLTADVVYANRGITNSIVLNQVAEYPQASIYPNEVFAEAADANGSFAGIFEDLVDDGSAIIKTLTLRDRYVVYKEASKTPAIFLGTYTGDLTKPFTYEKVEIGATSQALAYRNCVIAGGGGFYGSYHLYAGEGAFYKFDLYQMTPQEVPTLRACQDIFFDNVADKENAFVMENHLTREIVFVFGANPNTPDAALCYDYAYNTARTTSVPMTAAAKVRVGGDNWFVMGMPDGSLRRYGLEDIPDGQPKYQSSGATTGTLTNRNGNTPAFVTSSASFFTTNHIGKSIRFPDDTVVGITDFVSDKVVNVVVSPGALPKELNQPFVIIPAIYHRDGDSYDSVLESGLDSFGSSSGEKVCNEYVLLLSSKSPASLVKVDFKGGGNPSTGRFLQSGNIRKPDTQNLLKPTLVQYFIGVRVTVSGANNPMEIIGQNFGIQPTNSHSFGRRPL